MKCIICINKGLVWKKNKDEGVEIESISEDKITVLQLPAFFLLLSTDTELQYTEEKA